MNQDELEVERLKLELINVAAARAGLEFNMKKNLAENTRLQGLINIQLSAEEKLIQRISEASNKLGK